MYQRICSERYFDKEIKEADYIFGDIRVDFLDFEYIEKYGVTKDSGLSYFLNRVWQAHF